MSNEPHADPKDCPLEAALDVVADRWSFLIIRSAFHGLSHFEEFQARLGIARNILAQRLVRLTAEGILAREAVANDRRKVAYALTEKGAAILPALIALRQWGETWQMSAAIRPLLVEESTRQPIRPMAIMSHDGRALSLCDLGWAEADTIRPLAYLRVASAA